MKSEWPTHPLGDLAEFRSGGTPARSAASLWHGTVPWFSGKDLKSFLLSDSIEHISQTAVARGIRTVPCGTVLILVRGMALMKGVPLGITSRQSAFNQDVKAILPDPRKIDANFLGYFLLSEEPRLLGLVTKAGHGTGRLPLEALEDYPTPTPPLPEQRTISSTLRTWDEALGTLDFTISAKERRRTALMQQLLTGTQRFVPFREVGWKRIRMSDVLSRVFRPIKWSPETPLALVSIRRRCGGLFRRPDIQASDYKTQDLHEVKPGDFLISKRQVVHGAWALVTFEFSGCQVSKEYAIMINTAPEALHMPFFGWLAQLPRMIRLARVASTGVHIEKLIFDPDVFLRELIRIPSSLAEQQAIATILDSCDEELRLLRAQRAAVDQQKRGLMQRLLTGKVRVHS